MKRGKVVKIYLKDGSINGYAEAELLNWNAKAIRVPRSLMDKDKLTKLELAGVYFFSVWMKIIISLCILGNPIILLKD